MTREELDEVLSPDAMTKPRGMKPERRQAERRRRD
ncbi:MAG: hypothetical protein KY466_12665 [Gemmatimonadetes bacterium]|nr:hypothetical protein [Gemmatimonadota bacterium]